MSMNMHKQRITVLLFYITFVVSMVFNLNNMSSFNYPMMINWDFMTISTNYITYSIICDKISMSFSALVTLISGSVFMFSRWYMKDDPYYYRFTWILLSFVISMNFLIFSGSLMFLLIGWDGLGVTSFALIIYYQSATSHQAGFLTLMINRIGDILIMSVMFYYVLAGSALLINYPSELCVYMIWLFSLASLTKSAQYPFSTWLPAAMAAPTPVSALVHSSTLVTAGIYIMIRAFSTMDMVSGVSSLFLFCGAFTSLIGGMCAAQENDIKKVVAFSTLSQLGIMVFCLGLGSPQLALLHLYAHAMFKAMLFLAAGYILMMSFGVQDLRILGSITKSQPLLLVIINTSSLCLMGFPFLSAYYSKHNIMSMMLSHSVNLMAVIIMMFAVFYTSIYMLRMLKNLNWGCNNHNLINTSMAHLYLYIPCYILFIGSISLGWYFSVVDFVYVFCFFLPSSMAHIFDVMLLLSLLFTLLFFKKSRALFLFNMFFMEPMWLSSGRIGNHINMNMKKLETGWLEPYNFVHKSFTNYLYFVNNFMTWPLYSFNYSKYMILMVSVFLLCKYLK